MNAELPDLSNHRDSPEPSLSLPAQTLHDFVLNLLTDDAARSAFGDDPTAALSGAGLGDVTPQDIQEVAPLVADYAPAHVADALESLSAFPTGTGDLQGAIAQLQAVAEAAGQPAALDTDGRSLPVSGELPTGQLPVEIPAVGQLPIEELAGQAPELVLPSVSGVPVNLPQADALPGVGSLPVNQLPGVGAAPDADASRSDVAPRGLQVSNLGVSTTDAPTSHLTGSFPADSVSLQGLPADVPELDGLTDTGGLRTTSTSDDDGFTGTATYSNARGAAAGGIATNDGHTAVAGAIDSSDLGATGGSGVLGTDGVVGGLQSEGQFGSYSFGVDATQGTLNGLSSVSDLGDSLDSDALAKSAPAAGTLAGYVTSGGDLVGGHVAQNSATLGGYLTNAGAGQVGQPLADRGDDAAERITDGAHTTAQQLSQLPDTPSLPAPATPTDLATHLPADLPAADDLPVHASADLPQTLPHLPIANPLPEVTHDVVHGLTEPVTDAVSQSPLGDTAATLDHNPLSEAPGLDSLHNDLPFGH